jgi:hypothetical protein
MKGELCRTYGLALLQHSKHEQDVAVAGLQAPVVKATILLLVPRMEDSGQDGEAGGNVWPGHLQLARVPQAAPLQPGDVLDELGNRGVGGSELGWAQLSP